MFLQIQAPAIITSRLLPGVEVAGAYISIEYAKRPGTEGRTRYYWHIDLPEGKSFSGSDLQSGCGGGSLRAGLESLLGFLGACGDSWNYAGKDGENSDLFPCQVAEWAGANSDELAVLEFELAETPKAIVE